MIFYDIQQKLWWLLSIPSSGNLKNFWPMTLPWQSFTGFSEAFWVFCFTFLTYCFWLYWCPACLEASLHILPAVKHFTYMHIFKFLRKKNPVFSLLCVFCLASLWSMLPREDVSTRKSNWWEVGRLIYHFPRSMNCISNLGLILPHIFNLLVGLLAVFPVLITMSDSYTSITRLSGHN